MALPKTGLLRLGNQDRMQGHDLHSEAIILLRVDADKSDRASRLSRGLCRREWPGSDGMPCLTSLHPPCYNMQSDPFNVCARLVPPLRDLVPSLPKAPVGSQ